MVLRPPACPLRFLIALGLWHGITAHSARPAHPARPSHRSHRRVLFALWNYMGWDNASTVAQEVEHPQRNYPARHVAAAALVAGSVRPAARRRRPRPHSADQFTSGAWTAAGLGLGGHWLALAIASAAPHRRRHVQRALHVLHPPALRHGGRRPAPAPLHPPPAQRRALGRHPALRRRLGPRPAVHLRAADHHGPRPLRLSLILEFVALVVLRVREPALPRPFRVPGGLAGAVIVGVLPTALILWSIYISRDERFAGLPAALFAAIVAAAGAALYLLARLNRKAAQT